MTTTTELTAFVSDPIVKIKADIMAAEHYLATDQETLLDAALARIDVRLPYLTPDQTMEITERLLDAGLIDAEDVVFV